MCFLRCLQTAIRTSHGNQGSRDIEQGLATPPGIGQVTRAVLCQATMLVAECCPYGIKTSDCGGHFYEFGWKKLNRCVTFGMTPSGSHPTVYRSGQTGTPPAGLAPGPRHSLQMLRTALTPRRLFPRNRCHAHQRQICTRHSAAAADALHGYLKSCFDKLHRMSIQEKADLVAGPNQSTESETRFKRKRISSCVYWVHLSE